ncbi:unnamed protein product [Caenorhabditis sp. 36 PRJEB53466]|nr:unnamed protein product [Caenorhabditis sp. 36 PRJEB53466]
MFRLQDFLNARLDQIGEEDPAAGDEPVEEVAEGPGREQDRAELARLLQVQQNAIQQHAMFGIQNNREIVRMIMDNARHVDQHVDMMERRARFDGVQRRRQEMERRRRSPEGMEIMEINVAPHLEREDGIDDRREVLMRELPRRDFVANIREDPDVRQPEIERLLQEERARARARGLGGAHAPNQRLANIRPPPFLAPGMPRIQNQNPLNILRRPNLVEPLTFETARCKMIKCAICKKFIRTDITLEHLKTCGSDKDGVIVDIKKQMTHQYYSSDFVLGQQLMELRIRLEMQLYDALKDRAKLINLECVTCASIADHLKGQCIDDSCQQVFATKSQEIGSTAMANFEQSIDAVKQRGLAEIIEKHNKHFDSIEENLNDSPADAETETRRQFTWYEFRKNTIDSQLREKTKYILDTNEKNRISYNTRRREIWCQIREMQGRMLSSIRENRRDSGHILLNVAAHNALKQNSFPEVVIRILERRPENRIPLAGEEIEDERRISNDHQPLRARLRDGLFQMDDIELFRALNEAPVGSEAKQRLTVEMKRMKEDMERLLATWTIEEMKAIFVRPARFRCRVPSLRGESDMDKCKSALTIGGVTFLSDIINLGDFAMADRLRQTKLHMFPRLVSRDNFFRPRRPQDEQIGTKKNTNENDVEDAVQLFDILNLPIDMIGKIMARTHYKDAQNLAITCRATNEIYRTNSVVMLLPDIALILDFSSGELNVRWWLDKEGGQFDFNPDKILINNRANEKKKNQLLRNTTYLLVETTDDFDAEDIGAVRQYIGNCRFKRVVVKGYTYTENMKMMVDMFDEDCVEIEVNNLTGEMVHFPEIKTISVRDNLTKEQSERIFAAKHFINISCAITNIDTLRKALQEWDNEERTIGRWVILKPFTVFQTPFGRRHRMENVKQKGYLQFVSEMNLQQMAHGEITEYVFYPVD